MPCDFPLKAYRSAREFGPSGKRLLTWKPTEAISNQLVEIPCHNCMGCKLESARQWSVRMMHEKRYHAASCFLTLTYDDENVPINYGLDLRHLQLFMKKFRKSLTMRMKHKRREHSAHIRRYCLHHTTKIRFFACGEYGDLNGRPHYHAIIFNYDPPDKVFYDTSQSGEPVFRSEIIRGLWGHGIVSTQDVTHKSCAYVARYVTKKIRDQREGDTTAAEAYYRLSPVDGAFHSVRPEFAVMSRRPGIGSAFAKEFKADFYPSGFLVVDGVRQAPPRFYIDQLSEKEKRRIKLNPHKPRAVRLAEATMERRLSRAAVRDARIQKLQRKL